MKRSTKITSIIIIFFLIIASTIIARTMIGNHFQKKFSKKPPPDIIVTSVRSYNFSEKIESFGTAIPYKTKSFRVKKSEIVSEIKFNKFVKKGEIIAKLNTENIIAPFDGIIGKRGLSDDSSIIFSDLKIPETFASAIKKGLPIEARFSGYKDKIYIGEVDIVSSRINPDTRSLLIRVKIENNNLELIPGALLEITVKFNNRDSQSIPDTSVILEGDKVYVYKIIDENIAKKLEIKIGTRNKGNLEVISGLTEGDIVVAEGLKKVRPNGKIKPINK